MQKRKTEGKKTPDRNRDSMGHYTTPECSHRHGSAEDEGRRQAPPPAPPSRKPPRFSR